MASAEYQRQWKKKHPKASKGYWKQYHKRHRVRLMKRSQRYRQEHPEQYTADARRSKRKNSDEVYRKTQGYAVARKKYTRSGKKRLADANGHLKHAYGRTLAEKRAQYDKQKGICTLCGLPLPVDVIVCHWDHDHVTGRMRDILHKYCNQIVGWIENDLHEKAIQYVERHANDAD